MWLEQNSLEASNWIGKTSGLLLICLMEPSFKENFCLMTRGTEKRYRIELHFATLALYSSVLCLFNNAISAVSILTALWNMARCSRNSRMIEWMCLFILRLDLRLSWRCLCIFLDVTPSSLVEVFRRFVEIYCLLLSRFVSRLPIAGCLTY
jgi:hypothetical protein